MASEHQPEDSVTDAVCALTYFGDGIFFVNLPGDGHTLLLLVHLQVQWWLISRVVLIRAQYFRVDSKSAHASYTSAYKSLQWRHNGRDSVSNHQPHDCLLNGLFRRISKKTSKLRVTDLCAGNSPVTGEFPAQMASKAEMFPFDDVIMSITIQHEGVELALVEVRKRTWLVSILILYRCINYRKMSNIRRAKSKNLNAIRLVLELSFPNPMKPGVKSKMKM